MSFLLGAASQTAGDKQPTYTSLPIQTSVSTLVIPVGWGTFRLAPNLIWYNDFIFYQQQQGGGKGIGSGKGGGSQMQYSVSIIMGLCEGPVAALSGVWRNQSALRRNPPFFITFLGTSPAQTPWSYVTTHHSDQALGYPGLCYVAAANYQLGSAPMLSAHNFAVIGKFNDTAPWAPNPAYVGGGNADIALVIQDFLTNQQYGVQDFDPAMLDTDTLLSTGAAASPGDASLQTYCQAMGFAMSPLLSGQEAGRSVLQRWLQLANCAAVWADKKLSFVPYGDAAVTGNGVTYLPNLTPVATLSDDDFVGDSAAEPVRVTLSDPQDAKNIVRIEVTNPANEFALLPVEVRDEGQIARNGRLLGPTVTAHEIMDPAGIAPVMGRLIMNRGLYIRQTIEFSLSWEYCLLKPTDLIEIPNQVTGALEIVRVIAIDEDDSGELAFTCENFPAGAMTLSPVATEPVSPVVPDTDVDAAPVNTPVIFEPPPSMLGPSGPQVWIAASGNVAGGDPNTWGGAEVHISTDDITYGYFGDIIAPARMGVLTAPLPAPSTPNPDNVNSLSIDLSESAGVLVSGTDADADAGRTLCYVDGEMVSFVTATLTGSDTYDLTNLRRGMYGIPSSAHLTGTLFARLDDAVFKIDLPDQYIGETLYIKLVSFNIWRAGLEDISTVTRYVYTPTGAGGGTAPPRFVLSHPEWTGHNLVMGII